MSVSSKNDGSKWIQTSVAIACMLLVYVLISFFRTVGEWFELESKIASFNAISDASSVLIGIAVFTYIIRNAKTSLYLEEVYYEAVKVVWPEKDQTVRHAIGIMIGVSIVGFVLGFFDFIASYLLSLIN